MLVILSAVFFETSPKHNNRVRWRYRVRKDPKISQSLKQSCPFKPRASTKPTEVKLPNVSTKRPLTAFLYDPFMHGEVNRILSNGWFNDYI
jgi:hypothetical protein